MDLSYGLGISYQPLVLQSKAEFLAYRVGTFGHENTRTQLEEVHSRLPAQLNHID